MLYLDGQPSPVPNIVSFCGNAREIFLRQLLFYPWMRLRSLLLGDPRGQYRLPSSIYPLERHPLIEWADVINLHWVPDFVDYKRFFQRVADKPVVWTMHDMLPFSGGYHWETDLQHRDPRVEARITAIKTRATSDSNLAIVAPSSWLLRVSEQHRPFEERMHRHIFNGLPLDVYKPMDKRRAREVLNLPLDKKIILFTADRVSSERKGSQYVVEALPMLDQRDLMLVSVGRGSIAMDSSLDYCHLGVFNDEVSLSICYSCADLVVVPSIADNSPNIIIESFACGRPVAAFDTGGIGELVSEPGLGPLVPEIGSEALAGAIDRVLSIEFDPNFIREHAVAHFSMVSFARNYSELYRELLAG